MDDKILYELAEDIVLSDLNSPEPEYNLQSISNEKYQQLIEMINQREKIIQQQTQELDNMKKTLEEHGRLIKLSKVRSVQCLALLNKVKTQYMNSDPSAKTKLDELTKLVNRVRPKDIRELDRTEILEYTRQLGFVWRKSNSDYVTDRLAIRKVNSETKPNLPPVSSVQLNSQLNPSLLVSLQQPAMSPANSSRSPINTATSPHPVMSQRH
jgi:hypothetical protein